MWVMGNISRKSLFIYWAAQYVGAFLASDLLLSVYNDAVHQYKGETGNLTMTTAGIWTNYPSFHLSLTQAAVDQVVGTAVLLVIILGVTDSKNMNIPVYLAPLYIGLGLTAIHMSLALNAGCAINPARDLGPRLFTAMAGWGSTPLTAAHHWFWIPWLLPQLGAMVGVVISEDLKLLYLSYYFSCDIQQYIHLLVKKHILCTESSAGFTSSEKIFSAGSQTRKQCIMA